MTLLFALVPGKVAFERAGRYNRKVSVSPVEVLFTKTINP